MKKLMITVFLALASTAQAARLEARGEGVQIVPAEHLRLHVSVVSICHVSALDAHTVVDEKLKLVTQALLAFADASIGDQVQISPGGNSQQSITEYDRNTNRPIVICDEAHNWQSRSSVSFKLTRLPDLAQLQDVLFRIARDHNVLNGVNTPGLTISISSPEPGVMSNTWDRMVDNALKMAYQDALRQVKAIVDLENPNAQIKLVRMVGTPTASGAGNVYDRVTGANDTTGETLGKVKLELARQFVFEAR